MNELLVNTSDAVSLKQKIQNIPNISSYNGNINLKTTNKNILTSIGQEIRIGNSDTSINIIGSNIKINDELFEQNKAKEDITFSASDLVNNKFVVLGAKVGEFIVKDNNNYKVITQEKQLTNGTEINLTGFTVTGQWTIIFITDKISSNQNIILTTSDLVNNKYTINNCSIGMFSVLNANNEKIYPSERQSENNVILDFTGIQGDFFTIQFMDNFEKYYLITLAKCSNMGEYLSENSFTMTWVDPQDVQLNGSKLAQWNKTILVRKQGSYPQDYTDGIILATTSRSLQNKNYFRTNGYTDSNRENGITYYYKLFSQTTAGTWNNLDGNKFSGSTNLSWGMIQYFVRAGRGSELFPVGTVFQVEHPQYSTDGHGILFRVVGHDQIPAQNELLQHTMCLDMVGILFNAKFDGTELIYALTEDTTAQTGKTYYVYTDGNYSVLNEGTDWENGDSIPISSWYEKNQDNRIWGSNNFQNSNLLQWANSSGNANEWFVPKTIFDVCFSTYLSKNGFCKNLDPLFLEAVQNAKITTIKSDYDGGGASTLYTKFFPLSQTQVFGTIENNIQENVQLSYYQTTETRIKYFNGYANDWWLRSPNPEYSHTTHMGSYQGLLQWQMDSANYGVSLACIIA